jgi:hypothetical protein
MKTCEGVEVTLLFVISVLDGVDWSISRRSEISWPWGNRNRAGHPEHVAFVLVLKNVKSVPVLKKLSTVP